MIIFVDVNSTSTGAGDVNGCQSGFFIDGTGTGKSRLVITEDGDGLH